jgi:hypothetical protein
LDWLHHGLVVFIMLPWTCYFQPYLGSNMAVWGLTGLPGGLDYVLLTLVKLGHTLAAYYTKFGRTERESCFAHLD